MMRRFIDGAEHIYLACGATDFRKQIPGLSTLVRSRFHLDPFQGSSVFIFCNKKRDALKVLRYDRNGFILASKKLVEDMRFQWPKTEAEAREISPRQVDWLLMGLSIEQKKVFRDVQIQAGSSRY